MGTNHLIHFDLVVTDTGESVSFYQHIFNWGIGTATPDDYRSVDPGADPKGAIRIGSSSIAIPYFLVDDIEEILNKITRFNGIGGSVIQGLQAHPADIHYHCAVIADPNGVKIGLIQIIKDKEGSSPEDNT